MDEQNTVQAENENAAVDSSVVASPANEPNTTDNSSEQDTVETASSAEGQSEQQTADGEATESRPSRAERRIRDLATRLREAEQAQPPQYAQRPAPQPMFEDGREYTAAELERRMVQQANAIAAIQTSAQINQLRAETNLDADMGALPTKYPELDDTSDDFVPELVDTIEADYKSRAVHNGVIDPSVRLADVAESHVKAARAVAQKAQAKMKNAVAASADTAAPKPGGGVKQEKSINDMTSTEIEAMMRQQGRYVKA